MQNLFPDNARAKGAAIILFVANIASLAARHTSSDSSLTLLRSIAQFRMSCLDMCFFWLRVHWLVGGRTFLGCGRAYVENERIGRNEALERVSLCVSQQ